MRTTIPAVALFLAAPVSGWGPHPEIVDAALAALPADDHARLIELLGDEARRLRFLVWMGDFGNQLVSWNESWSPNGSVVQYYANDYLLFPLAPRLYRHECPDVGHTFTPFFLRSLQALASETPSNAARWIGSLLHYTTDTGSPPHAAGISGDPHSEMENWISGSAISITGYQPRVLGLNPSDAAGGFEERMAGLIEFSKQRAERLWPSIRSNDRKGAEPIALESANETARVTADLLETLVVLTRPERKPERGEIAASVIAKADSGFETLPAKLMLAATSYSTLSELVTVDKATYRGVLLLRDIQPGTYRAIVSRDGAKSLFIDELVVREGQKTRAVWRLGPAAPESNLVRNPDFRIRWASSAPDYWQADAETHAWVSDNLKAEPSTRYRCRVNRLDGRVVPVRLRWYKNHWQPSGEAIAVESEVDSVSPADAQYARISIGSVIDPAAVLKSVSLARVSP